MHEESFYSENSKYNNQEKSCFFLLVDADMIMTVI
jgi:hypothetical protein